MSSEAPTSVTPMRLEDEVVELIESGASIIVGTCNADLEPECARGLGARASADRRRLSVLLNGALSARMCDDLASTGRIAVAFSRIHDHHTIQVKGRVCGVRDGDPEDAALAERYLVAFGEQVSVAGLPRSVVQGIRRSPLLVVELAVEEIFDQTPGPTAGERLRP